MYNIKEIKEIYKKNNCCDYEIYKKNNKNGSIHTDNLITVDERDLEKYNIHDYEIMDQEKYDHSILANSCIRADFQTWYDDEKAKILIIIVEERED